MKSCLAKATLNFERRGGIIYLVLIEIDSNGKVRLESF